MAGGTVTRVNPTLLKLMKEKGIYSQELVDEIGMKYNGSVQSPEITWLTAHEKLVFKTAYEIDQKVIIDLAADRQPFVCQAQSINLFFTGDADESFIADTTQYAMAKKWIKSLYYQRSEAKIKGSSGKAEPEACVACEA
jgi:ribonucleoside-diphosphate reductase alpha chain